jgi:N-acetylglucosaminyldiphosphoundecaprenol N-acetyl-beta-D-mannosaminyltransferase
MSAVDHDLTSATGRGGAPSVAPAANGPWPVTFDVIGVNVSAVDIPAALRQFDSWIANRARQYVCVADVHAVMQSHWSEEFRAIHNGAGMVTPDGMPLVWLGRRAFGDRVSRVYGPDLLMAACTRSEDTGWRHFFYGGAEGVAEELVRILRERFPRLQVCGALAPPFRALTPAEEAATVRTLNEAAADIVWVGLGAPKQERWMAEWRGRLDAPVLVGIGAAFDFHSGRKPHAPRLIQRSGLEWLFRLLSEPKRLWPRYRRVIPGFLAALLRQKLGLLRR